MKTNKRILFIVNVDWFFISHRINIAEEALKLGYEIYVAAKDTGFSKDIIDKGFKFYNFDISRSSTNIFSEINTIFSLFKIIFTIKPNILHNIALKPVIYGSILAKFNNINNVVNSISGLGYHFTSERGGFIQKIILKLMRYGFNSNNVSVIFQNNNDFLDLQSLDVISKKNKIYFIKGSGVDLEVFKTNYLPTFEVIKFLFPARMLWDKGVQELLDATRILKSKYMNKVQFILAGIIDCDNKAGVPSEFLNNCQDGDYVKWIGYQKNMYQIYENVHVVVLPSYREGIPKSLIEACSMGRAIITTDAIGCRECVDEGVNGLKVPIKDSRSLANAIELMVNNTSLILKMGKASRLKAQNEFSLNMVTDKHIEIYNKLI